MKKIIKNWKHFPGVHCGSVALRDVMHYYDHNISEEVCFGLGGGLGFYYSDSAESPSRTIHVRGPWMEPGFLRHYGYKLNDWKYEENADIAHNFLVESINNDIPVLIQTDIFYLDYYESNTHFPGHIVVVCGYDDSEELFFLSDTSFPEIQQVSFQNMKLARNSKFQPYPLSNNFIDVYPGGSSTDIKEAAKRAIVMNAEYMLNGTETIRGKSGLSVLNQWAKELPGWKSLEDRKWCSRFAYQVISKRGVDGAAFRWMYRDFLKEVSSELPFIDKNSLIDLMNNAGKHWYDLSMLLKQISETESITDEFKKASDIVSEIFKLEKKFYGSAVELGDNS